jgi:hypothetical protein
MACLSPPRKVTYFEPVPPRLAHAGGRYVEFFTVNIRKPANRSRNLML